MTEFPRIFSHFRLLERLGSGGMGEVYRAVDNLDRTVAVKLLHPRSSADAAYREQLAREAKLAAQINSPYVVRIWEYGIHDNQPYVSMEFVAGEDLLTAARTYTLNQVLDLVCQAATGIQAAHDAGLVHRDLKPENIRLTRDGQVRIFDFGIARQIEPERATDPGTIEGTLDYLSPEHLTGEALQPTADLFSFGSLVYRLLTGQLPFRSEYAAGVVYSILHEDPAPPTELAAHLPSWIDPLVMTLLAKDPGQRFQQARQVVDFITSSRAGRISPERQYERPKRRVTMFELRNLSNDDSLAYICAGFTEDVVREVSRLTDLLVSAEPATAAQRNLADAFEQFRCDYVITGSLLIWEGKIRLQVSVMGQLGERVIYGQAYDRPSGELFDLLTRAARDIARALADATGTATISDRDNRAVDAVAYDFYLKGRSYYQRNTDEDLAFAARLFRQALEVQENFAAAHAGLADVYTFQYMAYYDRSPERIAAARKEAEVAIAADSRLPDAHRSLGRYFMFSGDSVRAEKCLLEAIDCDPKYALGYRTLGWLKRGEGKYDEATDWAGKSLRHAPTDLETLLLLGLISIDQHRFTPAIATLHRAIELAPDYGRAFYYLGMAYQKLGQLETALPHLRSAIKYKGDPNCFIDAGYVAMLLGDQVTAAQWFESSIAQNHLPFVAEYWLGFLRQRAGDPEAADGHFRRGLDGIRQLSEVERNDPQVEAYRLLTLAGLSDHQAVADLQILSRAPEQNGEVLWNLSRTYARLGHLDESRQIALRAVSAHAGPTMRELSADPHYPEGFWAGIA